MKSGNTCVCHAVWNSASTGYILLGRDWEDDDNTPPLFLGPVKRPFKNLQRATPEEFGRLGRYFKKKRSWHFILRPERYPQIDFSEKKVFLAGDFNGWGDAIGHAQWQLKRINDPDTGNSLYSLVMSDRKFQVKEPQRFKFVTEDATWLEIPDNAPNWIRQKDGIGNLELNPNRTGRHIFKFETPASYKHVGNEEVLWIDGKTTESVPFPPTDRLLEAKTDYPLGAKIEEGRRTRFRIFAPRATAVQVAVGHKPDGSDFRSHACERIDDRVWECVLSENLAGAYYWYYISGNNSTGTTYFDPEFPILDPYALASVSHRGPGIVIDAAKLSKPTTLFSPPRWDELVIVEAHVRDLIQHAPISLTEQARKGYTGLQSWIETEGNYLRELGVNAIELQPLQEFDNRTVDEYHWGYMPVNYFSPESSYTLHPEKASQIEELQNLIKAFHKAGIAVILDVVYNHVGEPNHLLFIDKYYYFNLSEDYDLMNWSGCGNDLRCDTPMGRHLIIESLKHWVEVFDIDGFRFDLAELVGTDVLETVEIELKKIKPGIILIAEPWSFRGHIQEELKDTGFASWSDGFRRFLPDYVCGHGNQDGIRYFLSGSPSATRFAAQVINYTESHDDRCWIDTITERPENCGTDPTRVDRIRTQIMGAILFASLGVPMLSAGQDFLRSKQGINNTYQRGDINALDYNRRFAYSNTHSYFAAWIRFRRSARGALLRFDGKPTDSYFEFAFSEGSSSVGVVYNADGSRGNDRIIFAANPHLEYAILALDSVHLADAIQLADQERFDENGLREALISLKGNALHLPPLSCGLWIIEGK